LAPVSLCTSVDNSWNASISSAVGRQKHQEASRCPPPNTASRTLIHSTAVILQRKSVENLRPSCASSFPTSLIAFNWPQVGQGTPVRRTFRIPQPSNDSLESRAFHRYISVMGDCLPGCTTTQRECDLRAIAMCSDEVVTHRDHFGKRAGTRTFSLTFSGSRRRSKVFPPRAPTISITQTPIVVTKLA
jgi:hypothetical protein